MSESIYKKETIPTSSKLDKELLTRIKEDAIKDRRSVSAQIQYMLTQYYEIKNRLGNS